jgi:hypothetical protein
MTRPTSGGLRKRGPNKLLYAGEAAASDLSPLDLMLSVMNDPTATTKIRMAMAARALPYCHSRLKSVEPPRQATAPNGPTRIPVHFVNPDGSPYRPGGTAGDNEDLEAPIVGRSSS